MMERFGTNFGSVRWGRARWGLAGSGRVWHDEARVLLSRNIFETKRFGGAGRDGAGRGLVRQGKERRDKVRQGKERLGRGFLLSRDILRQRGRVGLGSARHVEAGRGKYFYHHGTF